MERRKEKKPFSLLFTNAVYMTEEKIISAAVAGALMCAHRDF